MTDTITRARPAPAPARWSWPRTTRRVLLLLHVLTSVGWWGAAVTTAVFVATAVAVPADPALAGALLRAVGVAVWVTVAAGLGAGATGIALGLGTRWGLIRYRWVVLKEAITVVMLVTDVLVVRPGVVRVLAGTEPAIGLLGPTVGHVLFLTVATVLSVFKPWVRTRDGSRSRR